MPTFLGWSTGSFFFFGPDPFRDQADRDAGIYNTTTIELRFNATSVAVDVNDDDSQFHDATNEFSGPQTLAAPVTLEGTDYAAGASIIAEYSYVVRPVHSMNPADDFSIIVFRVDGDLVSVTTTAPIVNGQRYLIVSGGSDNPDPAYSTLAQPICFTPGTLIDMPRGPRAIETLRPGDEVRVRDGGTRQILWIGDETRAGRGRAAPVRVAAGRLGNARDLLLSPQHRVLVGRGADEALVPVKGLIDGCSVRIAPRRRVRYLHLLLDGHEVVAAEGAAVESLLPGPQALNAIAASFRGAARTAFDAANTGREWLPARPLLRPGAYRRSRGLPPLPR